MSGDGWLPDQTAICLLARHSSGVALISKLCQFARSLVSALEHVGKHHDGTGGCCACGGSAGIAAGLTGCESSGKLVGRPAQAVSRSASSDSVNRELIDRALTILNRLID